jgi:SAM-dependent methyltransferase
MNRTDIINSLIEKIGAQKYLEIGVSAGDNFRKVNCVYKVGVDPEIATPATIHTTSDEFFKNNKETFDVIFIDGLHHANQVYRDITNSLQVLTPGGYIVCHDMNPEKEEHQIIPFTGGTWNGDCWKSFVQFRRERDDLEMFVVDTDYGCGVITMGQQEKLDVPVHMINYQNFNLNRKRWLNLISVSEFQGKLFSSEGVKIFDEEFYMELLHEFIQNPDDSELNFNLALYYDKIGQTAAAMSYYLRTAERCDNDLVVYECLIRASMCFDKQGTRKFTVKGLIQNAITVLPRRPEAYYLLARYYERSELDGSWNDCYMISCIAESVCDREPEPLHTEVDYPGFYGILFQKAVSSWWCGLCNESRDMLQDLLDNYELDELHKKSVQDNLKRICGNASEPKLVQYDKSKFTQLRFKFEDSEIIDRNYSEAYQDMFVLSMLNGKKNGTYLEIGAGNAFYGNNTALLETKFGWNGVALDIDENFVNAHNQERKHTCLLKDALKVNYERFLNGLDLPTDIDYLQLDCDPPEVTYKILLTMPFETHRFAVITYEHDYYCDETKSFRDKSRKYLESFGYKLVVDNISPDDSRLYEDWWVHPDLVDVSVIEKMICVDGETKKSEKYMLNSL